MNSYQDISKVYKTEKSVSKKEIIDKLLSELETSEGSSDERLIKLLNNYNKENNLTDEEIEKIRKIAENL